jgi:hypothetical protein
MTKGRELRRGADPESINDVPNTTEPLLVNGESDVEPKLSVVIPTLNEQEGVARCIDAIKSAIVRLGTTTEIIVSDSSTDRTPQIARESGARVVEPDKEGYGYAYRYAFEQARGDYIVMGDADCTYDFESIPRLLTLIRDGEADIAIGSRLKGEIEEGAMPALHQYVGNPLLTMFLNLFYDAGVSDAHSGFRAFSRDAFETMHLQSDGMEFASEMVMDATARDMTIEEVPITYHERAGDETLDSFRDGWRHVKFMLVNAPTYLFTSPAMLFVGLGLSGMATSVVGMSIDGVSFGIHTLIAASLLTIVGVNIASLSVFSGVAADPIKSPPDPVVGWVKDNFQLEHGIGVGAAIGGLGAAYVATMFVRWVASGFSALPFVVWNMVAFTAIVVGVQLVFQSFFVSLVAETRN